MFSKDDKNFGDALRILYRNKTGQDEKIEVKTDLFQTIIFFKNKKLAYGEFTIENILNDLAKL